MSGKFAALTKLVMKAMQNKITSEGGDVATSFGAAKASHLCACSMTLHRSTARAAWTHYLQSSKLKSGYESPKVCRDELMEDSPIRCAVLPATHHYYH